MATRSRTRAASTPRPFPYRRMAYVLVPLRPKYLVKGKGDKEMEMSDSPRKQKFTGGYRQSTVNMGSTKELNRSQLPSEISSAGLDADSLMREQYTLEHGFSSDDNMRTPHRHRTHRSRLERTDTKTRYEELGEFREAHERFLKNGGKVYHASQVDTRLKKLIPAASVRSIATEILGDDQRQLVDAQQRQLQANNMIHPPYGNATSVDHVPSTSRAIVQPSVPSTSGTIVQPSGQPAPLDQLASLTSTEIVDQEKLHRQWLDYQATHPVSNDSDQPPSAHDIINAEYSEILRRFIQEQGLR